MEIESNRTEEENIFSLISSKCSDIDEYLNKKFIEDKDSRNIAEVVLPNLNKVIIENDEEVCKINFVLVSELNELVKFIYYKYFLENSGDEYYFIMINNMKTDFDSLIKCKCLTILNPELLNTEFWEKRNNFHNLYNNSCLTRNHRLLIFVITKYIFVRFYIFLFYHLTSNCEVKDILKKINSDQILQCQAVIDLLKGMNRQDLEQILNDSFYLMRYFSKTLSSKDVPCEYLKWLINDLLTLMDEKHMFEVKESFKLE